MTGLSTPWPELAPLAGLTIGTAAAGIKRSDRDDVLVFGLAESATCAGVFTQSAFAAPPVAVAKQHLVAGGTRFLLINSGNANACTGPRGAADAVTCCEVVAGRYGLPASSALPFSTGVIGEFLPMSKLTPALASIELEGCDWLRAARAIMTTDTQPKGATASFTWLGERVTVSGIAKGAGMIRPDMATMLAFVGTDAAVSTPVLNQLLQASVRKSFNRITIDGDTSTNDACILMATGAAPVCVDAAEGELFEALSAAVDSVMLSLAQAIVRDGEGVTKFITVSVEGGASNAECLQVAYTIAQSPLVKTAFYASDANWGRLVMAIGRAGVEGLDASSVSVWLDDVKVVTAGVRDPDYTDARGSAVVARSEFVVKVHLGRGSSSESIWTSDLSHDYVSINADYRT